MRIARTFFVAMLLAPLPSHGETPVQLLPTSGFVPNRGQAPAEVLYYAALPGGVLYLTRDAAVLDTWESERVSADGDESATRRIGRAVRVRFDGSNPNPSLEGSALEKAAAAGL